MTRMGLAERPLLNKGSFEGDYDSNGVRAFGLGFKAYMAQAA